MADDARDPRADLNAGDAPAPQDVGFFELLRTLERGGLRFGRSGGPGREPARLGQIPRLSFATRDISERRDTAGYVPFVAVDVLGLLGPEGPMPLHLTRWVLTRLSNRWFAGGSDGATSDTAFLDFCNMLQHRLIALYWRAWADARPEVQIAQGTGGRVPAMVAALSGQGLSGVGIDPIRLRHATALAMQVQGPERLTRLLADVVGAPVELIEFVGTWTEVPPALQTRLGRAHAGLGRATVLGRRVFERQNRIELRLGPLTLAQFNAFLDSPAVLARVREAVAFTLGQAIEVDLRLVLRRDEVPAPRLGRARLGRTAWLRADHAADPDDLRLPRVLGRTEGRRAA